MSGVHALKLQFGVLVNPSDFVVSGFFSAVEIEVLFMLSFSALIDRLIAASPDQKAVIEGVICDTFMRSKAVLSLDMSGFTSHVRRGGILPYLCQIRRMQRLTMPIVTAHGGELVKYSADNLLAVFDDPNRAVQAALIMIQAAAAANAEVDQVGGRPGLAFSIGIDFGEFLLIEGADCFGDPVNLACKLGEDTAQPNEVLITRAVRDRLVSDFRLRLQEISLSVFGVEIEAYRVLCEPAELGA
jgi:adenylate cyclase